MADDQKRNYDASDLKELMDNTGGWAHNWEDVLFYLRGPAVRDENFAKNEVPQLIDAVEKLKKEDFPFTTDYRKMWTAITGKSSENLPPPEGITKPPTNPIELKNEYLKGLDFPASKHEVVAQAKKNDAPERVMKVLNKLEDQKYKDMPGLLEKVGDLTWDHH